MDFLIITNPSEFSKEDISTIELMVKIAIKKCYLAPRPANWVIEMIETNQAVALKTILRRQVVACAMVSEIFQSEQNKIGLIHGAVWRDKYKVGHLLRETVINIVRQKFEFTLACTRKSNYRSLQLWTANQAVMPVTYPEKILPEILVKIPCDLKLDLLFYISSIPKVTLPLSLLVRL
jgi:hypothetical protein